MKINRDRLRYARSHFEVGPPVYMRAAKQTSQTFALRAPVTIELAAGELPGPPTFNGVLYSGGLVPGYTARPSLPHDYVVDLSSLKQTRNVVANLDHEQAHRVGHATEVANDGKELRIAGLLSAATPHRDEVAKSAADGFNWELSMEGALNRPTLIAAGKTAEVNGRIVAGPAYIFRSSRLTGLAFVSQGADEGNSVSIAATAAGENTMDEISKFAMAAGFDPEALTDSQRAIVNMAYESSKREKPKGESEDLDDVLLRTRKEIDRVTTITRMADTAVSREENQPYVDEIGLMARHAISEKHAPDTFELTLLRELRTPAGKFTKPPGREPDARVMEAALCLASGLPEIEKHFKPEVLEAVDDNGLRYFSLSQLLLKTAHANGRPNRPGDKLHQGNLREIMEYAFPQRQHTMRASSFSTISLPGILANVATKEILQGFTESDQTWREISVIKSVSDFKQMTAYRLTDSLEYDELPPGGEIKHGALGEETYTRQAKTYAKMIGLTREHIINDDLSAFDDLRRMLGAGAARKFNNIFWATFMANTTLFPTDNSKTNYLAGATTNLGLDGVGLGLAVAHFNKMLSSDGKRLGGRPQILLVPPEIEITARKHFISTGINTGGAATATGVPDANIFQNLYRPVSVPWLSDTTFTGNSTTAYYVLRDPRIHAAMVVSFLNGQQTPTVESTDADFNTLGILFRGYHDFGTDRAEYAAGVKVKGAA